MTPELCFKRASDMLIEYKKATISGPKGKQCSENVKWSPPVLGTIKINVDATINSADNKVGIGVVARNAHGNVLLSAAKTVWPFISMERAELEAFKIAIDFVKDNSWSNVIIEGYAQNVVNALCGKIKRGGHTHILVSNISFVVSKLIGISFSFCFREANNVAHRLAKRALTSVCSSVWVDGGPLWISNLVLSDFSV